MQTMTFEQFQATGRDVPDLRKVEPYGYQVDAAGRVYANFLVIEKYGDSWCLTIGNDSEASNDLPALERKLYEFGVAEDCL